METETNSQAGLMRRYLLGLLPEPEQAALEERFFEDGEILGEMRAVEGDLVDAYVRGRLAPDEKSVFESHYLSVHRHAERVDQEIAFRQLVAQLVCIGIRQLARPDSQVLQPATVLQMPNASSAHGRKDE